MKTKHWENATVLEVHPGPTFRVEMEADHHIILVTLSGRMWRNNIRVIPGDKVGVVLSPDNARGRIEQRFRI